MKSNPTGREAYKEAEKKLKAIKGFYINLFIYVITSAIFLYINFIYSPGSYWALYSVLLWGVAMALYGMIVFRYLPYFNRRWEERKLRELLEKESEETKHNRSPAY